MDRFFLVIGAQKAGTTFLYNILKNHPEINIANKKETKYFTFDELYSKGFEYYKSFFCNSMDKDLPKMDVDPSYLYFPGVPKRIYETLGSSAYFIVILRDPVRRAYSNYIMSKFLRKESLDFENAVKIEKKKLKTREFLLFNTYLERGLYSIQLSRYFEYFPRNKFKIYIFEEDFLQKRYEMINDICRFMDIKTIDLREDENKTNPKRRNRIPLLKSLTLGNYPFKNLINKTIPKKQRRIISSFISKFNEVEQGIPKLSRLLHREMLQKYFIEDIEMTEELIGRDLSIWTNLHVKK